MLRLQRIIPILMIILAFTMGKAAATTTQRGSIPCILCGEEVTGLEVKSTNTFGGFDLDSCPHPRGTPTVPLAMWRCGK